MKDFFGTTLAIGDKVAFNPPRYKGLISGKVTKFTKQMVEVEYYHSGFGRNELTRVFPRDTVKRPEVIEIETVLLRATAFCRQDQPPVLKSAGREITLTEHEIH